MFGNTLNPKSVVAEQHALKSLSSDSGSWGITVASIYAHRGPTLQ